MLSILIPTHNYDAHTLIASLLSLARAESEEVEVIVGDDASSANTAWLSEVETWERVRVLRNSTNLGRARNRNYMAEAAQGEWLLFMDGDAKLTSTFSLHDYLQATTQGPVVCGGVLHPDINPCPEATLRYTYERKADLMRSASARSKHPYDQLSTFSLLIHRETFLSIRFDEACTDYGYEDTLFGAELHRRNIPVVHIDNALLHMGLEPNEIFLDKTERALRTLSRIAPRLEGHSRLLDIADILRKWHLNSFVRFLYKQTKNKLRRNLLGSRPNLYLFSFYKLGYFLSL